MQRILLAATLALLVVAPASAVESPYRDAASLLDAPARQALSDLDRMGGHSAAAGEAVEASAYQSALTLLVEAEARLRAEAAWDSAQQAPEPHIAFREDLAAQADAILDRISQQPARFPQENDVSILQAEALAAAAYFLARAESAHVFGLNQLEDLEEPEDAAHAISRYTYMRPLTMADRFTNVAQALLEAGVPGDGPRFDLEALAERLETHGGSGGKWSAPEGGPLHRLARHVLMYEISVARESNATLHDLEATLPDTQVAYQSIRERGFEGTRVAAMHLDASWWVDRLEPTHAQDAEGTDLAARQVHASVQGAIYEAFLLSGMSAGGGDDGFPWMTVWWGGGAFAAVVAAFVAWRVGRGGRGTLT